MMKTRLLVAEDDDQLLEVVVDVLSQRGYIIAGQARNLPDAWQLMKNVSFDCAVLGLKLFGVEVTSLIDYLNAFKVPYVLMSGITSRDIDSSWLRALPRIVEPFTAIEEALATPAI